MFLCAGDGWSGQRHVRVLQDPAAPRLLCVQETHGQDPAHRGDHADR